MPEVIRSKRFGCGLGFSVEFEVTPDTGPETALHAIWDPYPPQGRAMRRILNRYRVARDSFLADIQRRKGVARITVREVTP